MSMTRRFEDHVVIVTGASRGIGKAIALAFASEGAHIVLNYASNHAAAEQAAEDVRRYGRKCVLVAGSVGDPAVAQNLADAAMREFGRIDVLVNNAGIVKDGHLMMVSDSTWRNVLDVNLHGMFYCTRAVLDAMIAQGSGAIVNMSSSAALRGRAGQVPYAATKGAVMGLTKQFAKEVGPFGIRVNAIAPGFIDTDMVDGLLGRPGVRDAFIAATPVRRIGAVEDVAAATLFLASKDSAYITGEVTAINGGLLL
ncbi:MAG: SDR family NAD(P)-dependent oxidoreductase [Thermoanaerobaculia bacterium]